LQTAPPLQTPPEACRSEQAILADISLAADRPLWRWGFVTRWWRDLPFDRLLATVQRIALALWGSSYPQLAHGIPIPAARPGTYLRRGALTPQHRLRFWTAALRSEGERLRAELHNSASSTTFLLTGRRRRLGHNSWLHGGVRGDDDADGAWLAHDDCARLGLPGDGGWIRVRNVHGVSLELRARADDSVTVGHVVIPHGLRAFNVNRLIPSGAACVEPSSGQHWMTGVPVSCERIDTPT
jgi:hypothetical protein